ncbi:winged helix domain-containing protein [Pararhizobium sp.]|uniref:winged helix domain-containing protein n=1 Tax=Pararhizobium sp. TaxID=1977563 RepID=UPI002724025F|nr:hypothetical protein [Pararhizobium sp.]MDO9416204.1 hypothetical protein [Pararhizobium sp.]
MSKVNLTVRILPDGSPKTVVGRDAWALRNLIDQGQRGCTPIDQPGPRWSHYVFKLRGFGFVIETVHEAHGGPYAGSHARYVLHSKVEVISDQTSRAA